ncbi:MAG: hypothetical protein IH600_07720 [Bacteroidetes bacterium]|nr:hypothetical protein [Bacteroidota bacterium]
MTSIKYALLTFVLLSVGGMVTAQTPIVKQVALGEAREVVAEINGGFGTLYLKHGSGDELLTLREKRKNNEGDDADVDIEYHVEDGIGYLTVDLGTEGADDMNALACLLKGKNSRTWYLTISDRVPIRFDVTLGAGKALIDLTDLHVREFNLDAGAGSVRLKMDKPNREVIGRVGLSAGVGSLRAEHIGNLRFQVLDFEGGLGEYHLDCTGELPDNARIITDVGVGSLTIVLPEGVGAKAMTDDNWFSSRKMYRFIRKNDELYMTPDYDKSSRRVSLDLQSGLGTVAVRWAK